MLSSEKSVSKRGLAEKLLILLITITPMSTVWAEKPIAPESIAGVTTVDANQAIELILNTPSLIVIDTRLTEEYQKGHIENAIPLVDTAINEETLAQTLDSKETPVLFYCNGVLCLRSSRAAQKALNHGYTNIYWFRSGWADWLEQELPVVR